MTFFFSEGRPISQDIPPDVANISMSGHVVPTSSSVSAITSLEVPDKSQRAQSRPSLTSLESESEGKALI